MTANVFFFSFCRPYLGRSPAHQATTRRDLLPYRVPVQGALHTSELADEMFHDREDPAFAPHFTSLTSIFNLARSLAKFF